MLQGLKLALGEGADLVVKDSNGEPADAAAGVEELAEAGVQVIVGPILSGEAAAAAQTAQSLGIPLITLARTEELTAMGPYVFRNMLTDSAQARAIVEYAVAVRGLKRLAVLYPEVDYGRQMKGLFTDQIEQAGRGAGGGRELPLRFHHLQGDRGAAGGPPQPRGPQGL